MAQRQQRLGGLRCLESWIYLGKDFEEDEVVPVPSFLYLGRFISQEIVPRFASIEN
jgi:hypothetical protein